MKHSMRGIMALALAVIGAPSASAQDLDSGRQLFATRCAS
jgi:hypothetical protein